MHKLSINLVVWNGEKYIPFLFESLKNQTFKDYKLRILDNASTDKTVEKIETELANSGLDFEITKGDKNLGFAGGHNFLYKKTDSEFVLLLNQDMYLLPDCIEKAITFLESHPDSGAVTPRLMKWNFSVIAEKGLRGSFSETPDSLGLTVFRNRRVADMTESQNDLAEKEVFGVSGALPIYRMKALKEVQFEDGNLFDSLYHSYKEDVDLSFRLFGTGWRSFLVSGAVAYHDRSASGPKDGSVSQILENKQKQSEWVRYNSYKNHLMTLYKNEYRENFLIDFFSILWYELRKFIYYLVFDPKALKGLADIWNDRKELNKKRAFISRSKKVKWYEFRKWLR